MSQNCPNEASIDIFASCRFSVQSIKYGRDWCQELSKRVNRYGKPLRNAVDAVAFGEDIYACNRTGRKSLLSNRSTCQPTCSGPAATEGCEAPIPGSRLRVQACNWRRSLWQSIAGRDDRRAVIPEQNIH
jgi:hypothetical protein